MNHKLTLSVNPAHYGQRLDVFLAKADLAISRSQIKQLILAQQVKVNQQPVKPHHLLKLGDRVQLTLPEPKPTHALPEAIPLDIIYEDPYLIVVNKPPDMVVHPAAGNYRGTLVNALLAHCGNLSTIGGPLRPGIVHRLDKNTSGLLVVAKTDDVHLGLVKQIAQRCVNRTYWGLVEGELELDEGEIEVAIGRHVVDRKRMSPLTRRGKPARTSFWVLERLPSASLLKLKLHTGRTHQIRVHLAHIGYPILGDRVYKGKTKLSLKLGGEPQLIAIPRQVLHAKMLGFSHPRTGKHLEFEAPLPQYMQKIIDQLRALRDDKSRC